MPEALLSGLTEAIGAWPGEDRFDGDDAFNRWAMEVHRAQVRSSPALRAFWAGRGVSDPSRWTDVPPVPVAAFKSLGFGPDEGAEAVFRTSGTTGGREARGVHRVASLALYRAAASGHARRCLLTGSRRVRLLALVPDPATVPDSSLGHMAGFIAEAPEVASVTWGWDPQRGVLLDRCLAHLDGSDEPVLLLSTAFALVLLLEALGGDSHALPPGSAVMETGGFKGRTEEIGRGELYGRIQDRLGVPEHSVVGEYGMTEMLSQSYDGVVGSAGPLSERVHRFPPWVRTRVLDPVSLNPLAPGQPGLLAHFDLACAGSVCHVLTEDVGALDPAGGFRLTGRATGAQARGCSLLAESFLRAVAPVTP